MSLPALTRSWLLSLLAATTSAQWPTTPAPNAAVADFAGDQTLARFGVTSDGGCYVGWFDHRGAGYAVYLQRFDAAGVEQWPHGGMLVSSNLQSTSLVDWDLIADSEDHCVLTFTDTRAGGDLDVYAYRIDANGTFEWGANGVPLSNNGDYEPNPRVCEASDGDFVFVWANTGQNTIQHQRLSRMGAPRFGGDGIATPGDPGAQPGFCRIAAADNGAVILSWVRTLAFSGNKHVHAQKFDALGNAVWNGGTRVAVFDQGSVPIAHEPRLVPDHFGGAVLAWHFAAGSLFSCRVQRLLGNGSELFPHNGVDVSTSANSKFDPAIVWQAAPQEVLVVWNERNVAQTTWGIFAQKLDALGARQWGGTGVTLLPIDNAVKFAPVAAPFGLAGIAAAVLRETGTLQKEVLTFGLDGSGATLWPTVTASTVASDKLRLALATTSSGSSLLAWTDARVDGGDIYAAAVDGNGHLGVQLASTSAYGCGGNPAGSLSTVGRPAFGRPMTLLLDNPLGSQAGGNTLAVLFLGLAPDAAFPCGTAVPGFGMAGPGQPGELLLSVSAPYVGLVGGIWTGPGQPVPVSFTAPALPALLGQSLYAQGLLIDVTQGALVPFGLSTGARLTLGS